MSHFVCAWTGSESAAMTAAPMSVRMETICCPPPVKKSILAQFLAHGPREREARREARRLDAEEMHESRHAVLRRPLDLEIGRGILGPCGLRTNAGIAGRERVVGQAGPVAANRRIEALGATRVDG